MDMGISPIQAYTPAYETYKHHLRQIALRLTRDSEIANEIVEHAFLKLITHKENFMNMKAVEGFLHRIVCCECRIHILRMRGFWHPRKTRGC